jgi:hypothetical protein
MSDVDIMELLTWLQQVVRRGRPIGIWKLSDTTIAIAFGGSAEPICSGRSLFEALYKLWKWEHPDDDTEPDTAGRPD